MVCKENVVSWFGNLSSYKRIDVMCTLLNMCLPFEVRYLGTCVEDLGKRDYNDLRDTEHRANNVADLAELTTLGVTEKRTRRKLALYMALLHSCNYACAVILYKNLSSVDFQEIVNLLNGTTFTQDDQPLEELLLLYTMALNHPAFTYEQKCVFGNIYVKLQEEEARLNPPKPVNHTSYKSAQGCTPSLMPQCATPNDRVIDNEITPNCLVPPPQMQPYHDIAARGNAMVTGIPPGLTIPPPGLCLPPSEQMSMSFGPAAQYLHLGFPSVNHMPPAWAGQVMSQNNNPVIYQTTSTGDMLAYPSSPLASRQSSPSQSRSPSRSNSPTNRRSNAVPRTSSQLTQTASNVSMTSASSTTSSSSISVKNATPLPSLPTLVATKNSSGQTTAPQQRNTLPNSGVAASRHNSIDHQSSTTAITSKPTPPPPRLRSTTSADSLRETLGKEMPNFKHNLQNFSIDEIRRMSDEDLRDLGLPSNAVGQLRSIVKGQTSNGLNPTSADKNLDSCAPSLTHVGTDHIDEVRGLELAGDSNVNSKCIPLQQQQPPQPIVQHHHHHHHNNTAVNLRRYPTISPMEPSQVQMYPQPPPVYATPNTPCYACLAMPVAGVQNRYSRCNAQHVYCLTQLQTLRLDQESSRHGSQSSSSDSTGSRSPPETPPAAPWVGAGEATLPPSIDHSSAAQLHSALSVNHPSPQPMPHTLPEKQRNRKNPTHYVRHKNQMVNGGPPIPHCVAFPPPPSHSPVAYLQHGHFPSLRPGTGIYSNFSHAAYARPTYPTYQPNGELIYQYPGTHLGHPGSGGTPPPPTAPQPAAAQLPQTTYLPPTPVVTYSPAVPPPKVSCYNCGSSNHHAADCKDQTMEDLTKRAQYRLDYTILKQPGDCPSSDK